METAPLLLIVLAGIFTRPATAIPISAAYEENLLAEDSFEFPTEETLHMPPEQPNSRFANDFVADLSRCVELRDSSSSTAQSADCMPGVFAAENVMSLSSGSNTVSSHVAANSSLRNGTMTFTINVTRDHMMVKTNSVRLRLYAEGIGAHEENDSHLVQELTAAKRLKLDTNIVRLMVSMTGINGQEKWKTEDNVTLTMGELNSPSGWLDLRLDTEILNNTASSMVEVSVSIMEANVSFCDLGIKLMDERKEPVLLVFGNEQPELMLQGLTDHLSAAFSRPSQRNRRQLEGGSGNIIADPENCRLIKHSLPFTLLGNNVINVGNFEFNYCSGQCIYPLRDDPYNHPELMALFQLTSDETVATPSPCCVPVEYKALGILVKETESNTRTYFINGLTATKCACR